MAIDCFPIGGTFQNALKLCFWLEILILYFQLDPEKDRDTIELVNTMLLTEGAHVLQKYPPQFFVGTGFLMRGVRYRDGVGVKLEGWRVYHKDPRFITKTSSGPLRGDTSQVLHIFALNQGRGFV